MKGWYNELNLILLVISNLVAIFLLVASVKWPRIARVSFFILFAWASWINLKTSQESPQEYVNYASLTWSDWYRDFISGWFASHVKTFVGSIAICQGLIALAMLLKDRLFQFGCIGGGIFLIAILPLGVGAGFPCTATMAIALYILLKKNDNNFIWQFHKQHRETHTLKPGLE